MPTLNKLLNYWQSAGAINSAQMANLDTVVGYHVLDHSRKRAEAQADAILTCKPYKPPEEDPMEVWMNPLIIGDKSVRHFADMADEDEDDEPVQRPSRPRPRPKQNGWGLWALAASTLLAGGAIGWAIMNRPQPDLPEQPSLPDVSLRFLQEPP